MPRSPETVCDATLQVLLAPGIGPATWRKLRAALGSDDAVAGATVDQLMRIDGIGRATAQSLRRSIDQTRPQAERDAMEHLGARLIVQGDADYPDLLAATPDPPIALWLLGRGLDDPMPAVGIVGSRRCTAYGREQAGRMAALLAQSGLAIVSGGAAGIDGEAHRGALRVDGRTIVVLGCGLAHCYPEEHRDLFARVVESGGALVTEYPTDMRPRRENFPRRNRIISGLSLGVLVIEAGRRSGALITARLATEDHAREVMALPGRVDSPASEGCLELIRDGGAALVTNHVDVIMQLESADHLLHAASEMAGNSNARGDRLLSTNLSPAQIRIMEALAADSGAMRPEQIAAAVQQPVQQILAELTLLQIRGLVARDHRGVRARQPRINRTDAATGQDADTAPSR